VATLSLTHSQLGRALTATVSTKIADKLPQIHFRRHMKYDYSSDHQPQTKMAQNIKIMFRAITIQ